MKTKRKIKVEFETEEIKKLNEAKDILHKMYFMMREEECDTVLCSNGSSFDAVEIAWAYDILFNLPQITEVFKE